MTVGGGNIRIIESKYLTSAVQPSGYPDTVWRDFAFVGRSNVGKSSMINTLTNRKLLAKIANRPGKTRLINFFEIKYKLGDGRWEMGETIGNRHSGLDEDNYPVNCVATPSILKGNLDIGFFGLVDLPGYGYAKVSKTEREQWQKMINTFFKARTQLGGAVVLVDIRHDPDPKDKLMIDMLRDLCIDFIIAATKCDKIPKNKIPSYLKKFRNDFDLNGVLIYEFSSLKKIGLENILGWIESKLFMSDTSGKVYLH